MRTFTFLLSLLISCSLQAQHVQQKIDAASDLYDLEMYNSALIQLEGIPEDSMTIDYYHLAGGILVKIDRYDDAHEIYTQGIDRFPESSSLHSQRGGVSLGTIGQAEAAIADYTRAVDLAESDTVKYQMMLNLAAAEAKIMDFESAYDHLFKAYLFDTTDVAVLLNLSAVADEVGKGDQTLKFLEKALALDPSFYPIYGNMGFKYQEMGDHAKAIEMYDKVLSMNPDDPLGYSNRSFNRLKLKEVAGAFEDIQRSLELYPLNSYGFKIRGLVLLEMEEQQAACNDFERALELGYSEQYGDEVGILKIKNCTD